MIFAFIEQQQAQFPIQRMCTLLGVSQSGYYAWRKRGPSPRAQANEQLLREIKQIFAESRQTTLKVADSSIDIGKLA